MTALSIIGDLCSIAGGISLIIKCIFTSEKYIKTRKKKSEPSAATDDSLTREA